MWWRPRAAAVDAAALRAALGRQPAGLHGAVCDCGAGAAAADAERQARPACAACAGAVVGASCSVRRERRRRRSCAGCLPRCWVLTRVGVDDNFFELGGDSIVSIQLVSRARRAGLSITPRAVFQHQTVEALAAVAGVAARAGVACWPRSMLARLAVGGLPATPIMRWLQGARRAVRAVQPGDAAAGAGGAVGRRIWRRRLQALLDHHDALRLRLDADCGGRREWRLEVAPPGAVAAGACLRRVDAGGARRWRRCAG